MKFTYGPEGQDPQTFDLDTDDYSTDEADAIEDAGGTQWDTFSEWVVLLNRGGWRAWRVALWIALLRTNPALGFEEVKPRTRDLRIELFSESEEDEPQEEPDDTGKSEADAESTDST